MSEVKKAEMPLPAAELGSSATQGAAGAPAERDAILELYWLEVLNAQKASYQTTSESFRDLDTKAQGAVAIAGIFLAAILAILQQGTVGDLWGEIAMAVSIGSLIGTVLLAIRALGLRKVVKPPSADDVRRMAVQILTDPATAPERIAGFYGDRASAWSKATRSLDASAAKKAVAVKWAQLALALAVLATGASAILKLLSP